MKNNPVFTSEWETAKQIKDRVDRHDIDRKMIRRIADKAIYAGLVMRRHVSAQVGPEYRAKP